MPDKKTFFSNKIVFRRNKKSKHKNRKTKNVPRKKVDEHFEHFVEADGRKKLWIKVLMKHFRPESLNWIILFTPFVLAWSGKLGSNRGFGSRNNFRRFSRNQMKWGEGSFRWRCCCFWRCWRCCCCCCFWWWRYCRRFYRYCCRFCRRYCHRSCSFRCRCCRL